MGVLLGAGASVGDLGGMTMIPLWDHFKSDFAESAEWLLKEGFISVGAKVNIAKLVESLEIFRLEWERHGQTLDLEETTVRAA